MYEVEEIIENHIAVLRVKKCECGHNQFEKYEGVVRCEQCKRESKQN
jgi:hypothetical protein